MYRDQSEVWKHRIEVLQGNYRGLRQEDILSSALFNLEIESIIRETPKEQWEELKLESIDN